ncbi:MAG: UDPglucose 6-dehydrogenase [Patescibacteria group bacterium]|nr:UDPglucose 6-dehydrogenase [Patescibacteria group bacterium]
MTVTVIGTGFVGVVTASVLSSFGNTVIGLDVDEQKIQKLRNSQVPFFEPGLEELLTVEQEKGSLTFTTNYAEAIPQTDVVMLAVGTPSTSEGGADLKYLLAATQSLAPHIKDGVVIAVKSTVPPGTLKALEKVLVEHTQKKFYLASLPEFLKEGTAVEDTLHPDRVVIGATEAEAFDILRTLHQPFNAPIFEISPESAQMAKYTANAYLATRITFINQIADLCEKNGADIQEVIAVIGKDRRIGEHYWYPGMGYGGSCFPKDVKELAHYSRTVDEGDNIFNKISAINDSRPEKLLQKYQHLVGGWNGKTVAVLGLSFKPNTDDMREAPSTKVIPILQQKGAFIKAYDPQATDVAKSIFANTNLEYSETVRSAVKNADVILVLIEWSQIVSHDYVASKEEKAQTIIDIRNQLDAEALTRAGYQYIGIGRNSHG